jgi:hypothetical protein
MEEPEHFSVFEVTVNKSGRMWKWSVCTSEGEVVMHGCEGNRSAAKYRASRALFLLLLSAPYRSAQQRNLPNRRIHRHAGPG